MQPEVAVPADAPPLAVDIDGTLTDDRRALDPRVMPVLRQWPSPVVVATGKSFPYPVALCEFLGFRPYVIAENGGVALAGRSGPLIFEGNPDAADAVRGELTSRGFEIEWGHVDLVNRWRETELAVNRELPRDVVEEVAAAHDMIVYDSGYAYHVTSPDVSKGAALERLAPELDLVPTDFLAIGDSENDVAMFEVADRSVAVGNADDAAKAAADHVLTETFGDGFLAGIEWLLGPDG